MWDRRYVEKGFGGETKGKRPLGRPEYRWEDNIKMIFKMSDGWAWTGVIWLRIGAGGGTWECSNEPLGSIKCREFLD